METSALIMMASSFLVVTAITFFYFYKAFAAPIKDVEDGRDEITKPDFT